MSDETQEHLTQARCILGSFPVRRFITEYFQKRPLFLRGALSQFESPLSADELAGLACEEDVEARLVENTLIPEGSGLPDGKPWRVRKGPIEEEDFAQLEEENWTLLVQDVDKWVPEVAALRELVNFLPLYSLDDIMVSYAAPGGSVGPHTDEYDVFLLQVEGTREWQLAERPQNPRYRKDTELKVLEEFEPKETHVARPGDLLYLPPGVAHFGVAQDECLTFSFGLRAPSEAALLSAFADQLVESASDELIRPRLEGVPAHPAELDEKLVNEAKQRLSSALSSSCKEPLWLGRMLTTEKHHLPKQAPDNAISLAELRSRLKQGAVLVRNPAVPLLFLNTERETVLFAGGLDFPIHSDDQGEHFAHMVTEAHGIDDLAMSQHSARAWQVLLELGNMGALIFS